MRDGFTLMATTFNPSLGDTIITNPGDRLKVTAKPQFIGAFKLMFSIAQENAAREAQEATPTLMVISAAVEHSNFVRIRSSIIAKKLNLSIPTIDRHLAKLRRLHLIEPDPMEADKKANIVCWRICPWLGWVGSTTAMMEYLKNEIPSEHLWQSYNQPLHTCTNS